MPSGSTSPVTRPNSVNTPTCPDSTRATEENKRMTTINAATASPTNFSTGLGFTSITLPRPSLKIVMEFTSPRDCSDSGVICGVTNQGLRLGCDVSHRQIPVGQQNFKAPLFFTLVDLLVGPE